MTPPPTTPQSKVAHIQSYLVEGKRRQIDLNRFAIAVLTAFPEPEEPEHNWPMQSWIDAAWQRLDRARIFELPDETLLEKLDRIRFEMGAEYNKQLAASRVKAKRGGKK
jgi:hypothetical protein